MKGFVIGILFCLELGVQRSWVLLSTADQVLHRLKQSFSHEQSQHVSLFRMLPPSGMPTGLELSVTANFVIVFFLLARFFFLNGPLALEISCKRTMFVNLSLWYSKTIWDSFIHHLFDLRNEMQRCNSNIFGSCSQCIRACLVMPSGNIDGHVRWTVHVHPHATGKERRFPVRLSIGHAKVVRNHVDIGPHHCFLAERQLRCRVHASHGVIASFKANANGSKDILDTAVEVGRVRFIVEITVSRCCGVAHGTPNKLFVVRWHFWKHELMGCWWLWCCCLLGSSCWFLQTAVTTTTRRSAIASL
mmetsp:Transcript_3435/g.5711  ORF Transcript_3435/g.5711 Transcript_3435/m.5711 type:complete len:303 (+) Transcript_3435:772-1680(+)